MTEPATEEKPVDPNALVDIEFKPKDAAEGSEPLRSTVKRKHFDKLWEGKGWTLVEPKPDTTAAETAAAKAAGKHADTGTTTPTK